MHGVKSSANRCQIRSPATHAMLFLKNRRGMGTAAVGTGAGGRASAAAAMRHPPTPVDATDAIDNLGPLAPLHAPLLLLLLALGMSNPLLDVVRVDLEVLLLVEALDDFFRRQGRDVHYFI